MITNQQTGRSKGFGFIEFTNYKEFQTALSQKEPIIFGKQQLVFNSAKNKYDNDDEFKDNSVANKNNNSKLNVNEENNNSSNGSDSFDNSISTAIISRDSNGSNNSNNLNNIINCFKGENNGFLGAKNKPDVKKIYKNQDPDDLLTLQIKYALSKMSAQHSVNNSLNKSLGLSNYFDYYFGNNTNNNNISMNNSNVNNNNYNNEQQNNNNINRFNNNYYNKFSINTQNKKSKNFIYKSDVFN